MTQGDVIRMIRKGVGVKFAERLDELECSTPRLSMLLALPLTALWTTFLVLCSGVAVLFLTLAGRSFHLVAGCLKVIYLTFDSVFMVWWFVTKACSIQVKGLRNVNR